MAALYVNRVAELARVGSNLSKEGKDDIDAYTKLTSMLHSSLGQSESEELPQALRLARRVSRETALYLNRAIRVVSGAQALLSQGDFQETGEWAHLIAIPLFLFPQQEKECSQIVANLKCCDEIARSLESALNLEYSSIRLCPHPVNAIELEELTMDQTQQVAIDIFQQGTSAFLSPPVIDAGASPEGAHHISLLWPAIWTVAGSKREEEVGKIKGAMRRTPALATFKHRADELLESELSKQGLSMRSDIYMPTYFHDAFSLFRMIELNLMLHDALKNFKKNCTSVSFGIGGQRLNYSLHSATGAILTADELRTPDEAAETISSHIRSTCARYGVACTAQEVS